jgi:hypothetical protein
MQLAERLVASGADGPVSAKRVALAVQGVKVGRNAAGTFVFARSS